MHPGKVWLTSWHRTSVAFKTVVVLVIIVPKRAANIDSVVADGKLKAAADGDAFRQINRERETVRWAVVRVEDVAGHEVVKCYPVVGCVTNCYLLAVTQIGHTNDARYGTVLFTNDAPTKDTSHNVTECQSIRSL